MAEEGELQSQILGHLKYTGLCYKRNHIEGRTSPSGRRGKNPNAGFPDIDGYCPNGRGWCMELKSKKGVLSVDQLSWKVRLETSNVLFFVIKSFAEYLEALKIIKKEK